MKFIPTLSTLPSNGTLTLTSIQRVSRGIREGSNGLKNYGVMIDDAWTTIVYNQGDAKLFAGQYVYTSPSGCIAIAEEIEENLNAIDSF